MKPVYFLFFLPLFIACNNRPDHFVLYGTVPGAMDSTLVTLRCSGIDFEPIKAYIIDGRFELTGSVANPMHARLSMKNSDIVERRGLQGKDVVKYREADIFIENGRLTFTTPHIDSLPQSFWLYDIRRENNYTFRGSASHDAFDRFRRQTMDLQAEIRRLERAYMEGDLQEEAALEGLQQELEQAIRTYIASQRNLAVNLYLAQEFSLEPFTYDQAYLDKITALFADYTDTTANLLSFRKAYQEASTYVRGKAFSGGEAYTPTGDTLDLKTVVSPDRYTLIDFWASWCLPCRGSFPHLRKMHDTYGSHVRFISVSVDKKENDWRKALSEELLPWTQFCATSGLQKNLASLYAVKGVPTFLLIDPEGRIIFSGHSSRKLEKQLETSVKIMHDTPS